jgi:hypothetical protein
MLIGLVRAVSAVMSALLPLAAAARVARKAAAVVSSSRVATKVLT